jgi:hypothetical protein
MAVPRSAACDVPAGRGGWVGGCQSAPVGGSAFAARAIAAGCGP